MINIGPRRQHPVVVLLLGLLMFALLSVPALAADDADLTGDTRPAIALRLSPAVLEVPHESGSSRHELRVDNLGSQPLTIVTQLSDFIVTEDGTTQFLGPQSISATAWASLDVDTFELAPGERRDVVLTVEVPFDAEPGERYLSAIFSVPGDTAGGGNISVTHRVAVKLYIAVPGERTELVELGELSGPRLIDTGPATFELTMHNRGNVHRRFEEDTQLLATNSNSDFAFENFTVLGDSSRVVKAVWPNPPMFCWCTVDVDIDDGQGNLLTVSTRVIAFPLRLSLALLTLTGGLAILAVGRRRRRVARFDRQLQAARREGANTPSAANVQPQRLSPPVDPPAPRKQPATWSPPTPADPSAPQAHATTATIVKPSASAPRTESQPLNGTMFTAHGNQDRQGRRRRRRE